MYGPVTSDLASDAESAVGGDVEDGKPKVKQAMETLLRYSFALIYSRIVFQNEFKSNQNLPYFIIMLFHPDSGDVYS
jgi:hypothetical protein